MNISEENLQKIVVSLTAHSETSILLIYITLGPDMNLQQKIYNLSFLNSRNYNP